MCLTSKAFNAITNVIVIAVCSVYFVKSRFSSITNSEHKEKNTEKKKNG